MKSTTSFCVLLAVASTIWGCADSAPPPGIRWTSSIRAATGDDGEYTPIRLRGDGRIYAILAVDAAGRASVRGGGADLEGTVADSYGRRELVWSSSVDDDLRGQVVIQGSEFDLANGGFFLIRTTKELASVEQIDVPLEGLVIDVPSTRFSDEGAKHPQIATFLEEIQARLLAEESAR